MKWLQVTLDLEADLAEPAAELLSRVAPNGVAIEMLQDSVRVLAWLPDDEALPDRRRRIDEGLWHLGQIQAFPSPQYKFIEEEPWEAVWKDQYQPLKVGKQLQILPAWMEQETGDRYPVYLEPGMAFGTGAHTTTRHCLEALEDLVKPGDLVVDLGCGSGILAIAAARLGAGEVEAFDLDQHAVQLANENVLRNGLERRVRVVLGSMDKLKSGRLRQVIVANIRASILEDFIRNEIATHLASDGRLVMSGLLEHQIDPLIELGSKHDLAVDRVMETGDWRSVVFSKST